jgi:hypothetical protein
VLAKRFAQRSNDLWLALLPFLTGQPDDFTRGPKRHCELDRIIQGAADTDIRVVALEGDAVVTGRTQHLANEVRPCHREGAGSTMNLVGLFMRHNWYYFFDPQLSFMHPRIILPPAPNDHRQPASRSKRTADVTQCRPWQVEKHSSKTRENAVIGAAEVILLYVGDKKRCILCGGISRLALRGAYKI